MTGILDGEQTRKKGFRANLTESRIRPAQGGSEGQVGTTMVWDGKAAQGRGEEPGVFRQT